MTDRMQDYEPASNLICRALDREHLAISDATHNVIAWAVARAIRDAAERAYMLGLGDCGCDYGLSPEDPSALWDGTHDFPLVVALMKPKESDRD